MPRARTTSTAEYRLPTRYAPAKRAHTACAHGPYPSERLPTTGHHSERLHCWLPRPFGARTDIDWLSEFSFRLLPVV